MDKTVHWNGGVQPEGIETLSNPEGMIVSPTKVGYIIMATGVQGLNRKFNAKQRKLTKPAVVLCGSLEELFELAEVDEKIKSFYTEHWNQDILLGCILPWSKKGEEKLKSQGINSLVTDGRNTSCFVIKFGVPSENLARELWEKKGLITFASSANPSGIGNKGKVEGIGDRIYNEADIIIESDDYVKSIQPDTNESNRYEQGVMVSMVDKEGKLVTNNEATASAELPKVIRKGLDIDKIMMILSKTFNNWNYRHGDYY